MRPFDTLELPGGVYERTATRYNVQWITLGHIVENMRRVLGLVRFGTRDDPAGHDAKDERFGGPAASSQQCWALGVCYAQGSQAERMMKAFPTHSLVLLSLIIINTGIQKAIDSTWQIPLWYPLDRLDTFTNKSTSRSDPRLCGAVTGIRSSTIASNPLSVDLQRQR
jgi:hypothetical protein